ncbi:S-layer homology domain-containing protein [Butyricicoccus sp. AF10-3]|nr:S-layer homology domain-containing protein [Butyricicoccus sp. AF10-3]RHS32480.1 S-layer homology domain-containing protein [Butyricicoccus sp. AF10-3]
MKRRLLSAFLAVMMVLTMAPMAFAADEGDTLQSKINNASDKVTLTKDYAEDITIPAGKTITLDLNGKTLTNASGNTITVEKEASLTIQGKGTVDNVTNGKTTVYNKGTVVLKGGTYKRSKEDGVDADNAGTNTFYTVLNHGQMTINGGVTIENSGHHSSMLENGYYNGYAESLDGVQNPEMVINSGTFDGGLNTVKNDDNATLTINDGNFSNYTQAAFQNHHVATINGGTFNAENVDAVINCGNAGCTSTNEEHGKHFTQITGGIFNGGVKRSVGNIEITGGAFTADVSAYVAEGYKSVELNGKNIVVVDTADTEVAELNDYKFTTVQNAVDAAADGNTVTLLRDIDLADTVTVANKTITLDMAGKTIFNTKDLWDSKPNAWSLISVRENGNLTITGNGMLKAKADDCYALDTQEETAKLTVENGTVIGNISAIYVHPGQVTIKGGNYSIQQLNNNNVQDGYGLTINCYDADYKDRTAKVTITGGYFAHFDPANNKAEGAGTNFVADGYISVTSDKSGYDYMVTKKTTVGTTDVTPDVAEPEVTASKDIPSEVTEAAKNIEAPDLATAANDIVKNIGEDTVGDLVHKSGYEKPNLYVQTSLKVEAKAYDATAKTLTLDITPQYRIVASTADKADALVIGTNAKIVQEYAPATLSGDTTITMELPAGFAVDNGAKLSIQHTKSNGTVEYYTGTVTEQSGKHLLTFTTNGFSPFVISVPAASIGENVYPTLQAAVDSVKNNETIKLAKDVDEAIVVTVAKSINFKVDANKKKFDAKKNIVAGSNTTVKVTGESSPYTYEFTYTKPSSSGGSSSGKTTYKVTTSAVNNGGVNASPSSAEKGATITITLSPDKGYKLDKLTVTDGSGKTVSTVKKSDTVYTFTMPASAVKVGVSYVKATETPSKTKFNDVSANDWFASAVDYVTGKGMMNGTADNTFSPKANTTRGMVVTVLYRLENQPSTSAASFTDVASGAYYANAVAWANANGIVSGYGSGKFGPNDKVTREQLAAILYRYAQYKKYDVSVGEDTNILSYDDAQSISSYAIPAIQWACGAGVVTGKSGSKLDPKGNATRAEVAAMLMRFCENVK